MRVLAKPFMASLGESAVTRQMSQSVSLLDVLEFPACHEGAVELNLAHAKLPRLNTAMPTSMSAKASH